MTSHAKLIAATQPVGLDGISADEFVAYVARVSSPGNQLNHETAPRLLRYLRKHSHWSPFEMAHAVIEIVTTRDIGRQILRHRSFSFQEFSQRYSSEFDYGEPRQARLQDKKNRQNSFDTEDKRLHDAWQKQQEAVTKAAQQAYDWAVGEGIAKEIARTVLPEGLTLTRLYMAGSLRSWIHYCDIRTRPDTQKEQPRRRARLSQRVEDGFSLGFHRAASRLSGY